MHCTCCSIVRVPEKGNLHKHCQKVPVFLLHWRLPPPHDTHQCLSSCRVRNMAPVRTAPATGTGVCRTDSAMEHDVSKSGTVTDPGGRVSQRGCGPEHGGRRWT